jgi:hypothetical protein
MDVVCSECGRTVSIKGQLEPSQLRNFVCNQCADPRIYLELINFIKTRIAVTRTAYENQGRMVLRELVQNADDAGATILVLRFRKDALYVANDGRAFTTGPTGDRPSDFDRLSQILARHKAEDLDATGHFGSGFQTVYVFTNRPEVHSGGRSCRTDPVRSEWEIFDSENPRSLVSPYEGRKGTDPKGVLFRFPWRTDAAAGELFGKNKQPFLDDAFPRWSSQSQAELFQNLKGYLRHAFLCCRYLKSIRLIWDDGDRLDAFQASRDFAFAQPFQNSRVCHVDQGEIAAPREWLDWDPTSVPERRGAAGGFDPKTSTWGPTHQILDYLVVSGRVSDETGKELHVGKSIRGGEWIITGDPAKLAEITEKEPNDIHLLLPLFDVKEVGAEDPGAFLYSVIPLPSQSKNFFAFSGHFFPDESRMDVSVASRPRRDGEWHQDIVRSIGRLYLLIVEKFVDRVRHLDAPVVVRQQVVLNVLPACHLSEWMRPGKEPSGEWVEPLNRKILESVAGLPIIASETGWRVPNESIWTAKADGSIDLEGMSVVSWLGQGVFTPAFTNHRNFSILRPVLRGRIMDARRFCDLYSRFLDENGGQLRLGQKTKSGGIVERPGIDSLLAYCVMGKTATPEMGRLPIVPGKDGLLRPLQNYPIVPQELRALEEILPESRLIHPDYETRLTGADQSARSLTPDRALVLVNDVVRESPERFDPMSSKDMARFSRLLVSLSAHPDFGVKQAHLGLKFIPVQANQKVWLSPPNAIRAENGDEEVFLESRPEPYRREFIWVESAEPVPGMTPELHDAIRFLRLEGAKPAEVARVGAKLNLIVLHGGRRPTNFVRQFLSDRQPSLFRDDILSNFLGIESQAARASQKKTYLAALRTYFRPTSPPTDTDPTGGASATENDLRPVEIGRIPCLYDQNGTWLPANSFCLSLEPELKVLKYRTLHADFVEGPNSWPAETLFAIGVARQPSPERVIEEIRELNRQPSANRAVLSDLFFYLVTAPHTWGTSLDALRQLDWVPAVGGGFQKLGNSLIPTKSNIQIVGPSYSALFDGAKCSPKFVRALKAGGAVLNPLRVQELHVLLEPTNQMLLELCTDLAADQAPPPPDLFETIRGRFKDATPPVVGATGWFYHAEKWWRGKQVFRESQPPMGAAFDGDTLFLSAEEFDHFRGYLLFVGAHEAPDPKMLLARLQALSLGNVEGQPRRLEAVRTLWTALEEVANREGSRLRGVSPGSISYPVPGGLIPVDKLILVREGRGGGEFFPDGRYGRWYVASQEDLQHPTALAELGARNWDSLDPGDLIDLLQSIGVQDERVPPEILESIAAVLTRIWDDGRRTDLGDYPAWPVREGDSIKLCKLSGVYIGDSVLNRTFEGAVPFLYEPETPQLRSRFVEAALGQTHPCKRLGESVETVNQSSSPREDDPENTERIRLMAGALRVKYPESPSTPEGAFEWLEAAKVSRVVDLTVVVQLGRLQRSIEGACRIKVEKGVAHIDILPSHRALPDDLTRLIADETVRRGLRLNGATERTRPRAGQPNVEGVSRMDLESTVYRLLTRPAEDWDLFVTGLVPIRHGPPPLTDVVSEPAPGYGAVLQRLRELYGYCQICGRKTPEAEGSPETRERVRSLVSERGGRYPGPLEEYDLRNSLFLCPSHFTLFERGLVKFADLEVARDEYGKRARQLRSLSERWTDDSNWIVSVYEAQREDQEPAWMTQSLKLKEEHARVMLKWLAKWLEGGGPYGGST